MSTLQSALLLELFRSLSWDERQNFLYSVADDLSNSELEDLELTLKMEKNRRKQDAIREILELPDANVNLIGSSFVDLDQPKSSQFMTFHVDSYLVVVYEDYVYCPSMQNFWVCDLIKEKKCGRLLMDAISAIDYPGEFRTQ
jgi:hypothetical protein